MFPNTFLKRAAHMRAVSWTEMEISVRKRREMIKDEITTMGLLITTRIIPVATRQWKNVDRKPIEQENACLPVRMISYHCFSSRFSQQGTLSFAGRAIWANLEETHCSSHYYTIDCFVWLYYNPTFHFCFAALISIVKTIANIVLSKYNENHPLTSRPLMKQ